MIYNTHRRVFAPLCQKELVNIPTTQPRGIHVSFASVAGESSSYFLSMKRRRSSTLSTRIADEIAGTLWCRSKNKRLEAIRHFESWRIMSEHVHNINSDIYIRERLLLQYNLFSQLSRHEQQHLLLLDWIIFICCFIRNEGMRFYITPNDDDNIRWRKGSKTFLGGIADV